MRGHRARAVVFEQGGQIAALVGAAAVDAWELTECRRPANRGDRIETDPFDVAFGER